MVGGGASGLLAAGMAAQAGASVTILEKMERPGRKLRITGKGRCNITNIAELPVFLDQFGKTGRFLRQAFARCFSEDIMDFFYGLGLALKAERGGRVFPESDKAVDVLNTLLDWAKDAGVTIECSSPVDSLLIEDGQVTGVVSAGTEIKADAVILATGGMSYPLTGSTGDGYKFAESAGHSIVSPRPALVPLETEGDWAGRMTDLNLRNVEAVLFVDGKKKAEAFGELFFAEYGVTGPVILRLSGLAVEALQADQDVELAIDLKPALDRKKLNARLLRDFVERGTEHLDSVLRGLLPRQMVPVCLELNDLPAWREANKVTAAERKILLNWLKEFRLEVTGHRPIDEAIITAGGVDTREVNPKTMESRKCAGLFICGELLNIQANTGGYNLQAAFSTGWLAGQSAAS